MANKKDREVKKAEKDSMVTFTNGMLERFTSDTVMLKLMKSDLKQAEKFKLFQLSMSVVNSPEIKAYTELKNETVKKYVDGLPKVEGDKNPKREDSMPVDHPEILELLSQKTTLTIKKPQISSSKVTINAAEMVQLSWIIDFVA
jgi:hypothetical protein